MIVRDVDGGLAVDLMKQPISDRDNPQVIPLFAIEFFCIANGTEHFRFSVGRNFDTLSAGCDNATRSFSVKHAKIILAGVQVGLVTVQYEFFLVRDFAAILDARVVARKTDFAAKLKITNFAALPDQKRIAGRRVFGGGLTDDRAVFDRPEFFDALPAGQVFSIKQDFERAFLLGKRLLGKNRCCHDRTCSNRETKNRSAPK